MAKWPMVYAISHQPLTRLLLRRRRSGRGLQQVFLPEPRVRALPRDLHYHLTPAFRRIGILRVVTQNVVVARLRVDPLQRLAEVVLIDDCEAAGLFSNHPQTVLRLPDV